MPLLYFFHFGGEVVVDGKGMKGVYFHTQQYPLDFSKFTVDLPNSSEEVVFLLTKVFILFSYIL